MSAPHHSIAELVHHLHESLIHDLLTAFGEAVQLCVSRQAVSTWPETMIVLTQNFDRSLIGGQELVHDFDRSLIGAQEHVHVFDGPII